MVERTLFKLMFSFIFIAFDRLLSIAEETLTEFLSKATGTAVDWVQMPGMKVRVILNAIRLLIMLPCSIFIQDTIFTTLN